MTQCDSASQLHLNSAPGVVQGLLCVENFLKATSLTRMRFCSC